MKFNFSTTYQNLPSLFFKMVEPAKPKHSKLLFYNQELADYLKIEGDPDVDIFSGKRLPENSTPMALAYAGHQFGHFVPLLGDGRAVLLGEVLTAQNERFDIQLKGSGQTPYSRRGDGKSAIGPVIREYIVSEAMHALKIPTTRSLAAVATDDTVYREEGLLPAGVLTRVAKGHLRVGTFEFAASQGDIDHLKQLLNYAITKHYPELLSNSQPAYAFLDAVIKRQIGLVSKWMGIGFIHGVMNTDNTSISGETLDFGPCAFMDEFNRHQVYSYIDEHGRYAYYNQANILQWNMARLAECLVPLIDEDEKKSIAKLSDRLQQMSGEFHQAYLKTFGAKLGFNQVGHSEEKIITRWLDYLEQNQQDFTNSFKQLPKFFTDSKIDPKISQWFQEWNALIQNRDEAINLMNENNPVIIPRNHLIQKAVDQYMKGNHRFMNELHVALKNPFSTDERDQEFRSPPKEHERIKNTFCGT